MNRSTAAVWAISIGRACAIAGIVVLSCVSNAGARSITVISGTYGANCGASVGNATADLGRQCDGHHTCRHMPDL